MKRSVQRYGTSVAELFADRSLTVFLCGPSYKDVTNPGARLRKRLEDAFAVANFEVVLGEDDGLAELQKRYSMYAHSNELAYIKDQAAVVVLVAASAGSFCELGLFSYVLPHDRRPIKDLVLLVDEKYKTDPSYVNKGPALAVGDFGQVLFVDFDAFDVGVVVQRLSRMKTLWIKEKRGRPRQNNPA
jgi:hypothetical protein